MKQLEGLLVVALEQAVAAPFCTARLADAGARVIKVERPEGDFARSYDRAANGMSSYFVWLNRGKESVVIDLSSNVGRGQLEALIGRADILIQNLKPGALGRLGFPIERLRTDYPSLICCSISGYGDDGPLADRKAYDLLIQAESGLASITGTPDAPGRVGISVVDIATGATAHAAILEAMVARTRSGRGADIRISMFGVMADWLSVPLFLTEQGQAQPRTGLTHPMIAPYGAFRSGDGHDVLLSTQSDREWRSFCTHVLFRPELGSDDRFATNVARVKNRAETDGMIQRLFSSLTRTELLRRLEEGEIAFAEINDMKALAKHPQLKRIVLDTPNGTVVMAAPGAEFDSSPRSPGAVPALGANSAEVLAEFTGGSNETGSR
jgi:itaconate CoA-transferase